MITTKVMLLCASIIAISLCQLVILAQVQTSPTTASVEIHGQIRFAEGGTPAQQVLVRLESYDGGGSISEAFTDASGKFRFSGLSPGQYSIRVRQSGYREAQQNIDMTTTASGLVLLQLVRDIPIAGKSVTGGIDAHVPPAAQKEFDKGVAALAQGGKDKTMFAVKCFEKAVSIYPKFVEAHLRLGTAYMDLAEWDKAEKALLATRSEEDTA